MNFKRIFGASCSRVYKTTGYQEVRWISLHCARGEYYSADSRASLSHGDLEFRSVLGHVYMGAVYMSLMYVYIESFAEDITASGGWHGGLD